MTESRPAKKDPSDTVRALLGRTPPPARTEGPRATPRAPRKAPAPPEPDPTSSLILQARIPVTLFELARTAKDATGDTHETWFLDALDAVIDDLGEVYQQSQRRSSRVPVRRRRTRRPSSDPLVAYPLRLSGPERAVLDDLVAELAPPSLADLVTTVVRLRLQQLGVLD